MVRQNLVFFINATIDNPSFDSQMKDCLTTRPVMTPNTMDPLFKVFVSLCLLAP